MNEQNKVVKQLYSTYQGEIKSYILNKFRLNTSEAEDIIQTIFISLSNALKHRDIKKPRAFLYQSARNQVIDHIRQVNSGTAKLIVAMNDDTTICDAQASQHSTVHDPARIYRALSDLNLTEQIIRKMPETRRKLLYMSRFENLSNVEIAKRVGITEGAVRKHIARAILDIKRQLDASGLESVND